MGPVSVGRAADYRLGEEDAAFSPGGWFVFDQIAVGGGHIDHRVRPLNLSLSNGPLRADISDPIKITRFVLYRPAEAI